jgi:hypothetical protein
MAQTKRKQQDDEALEEERLDEEQEGDDPEADAQDDGSGVNIAIESDHISVEIDRDGTEAETLRRIGDLVDGL